MEGNELALALKSRGFTHEQLAGLVGVTRPAVSQWIGGQSRPSGPARRQLALALGVPLDTVDSWFTSPEPALAASAR